jgi:hypothetical protein
MALHLIKLCVGAESIADLTHWHRQQVAARLVGGLSPHPVCDTRQTPKRVAELMAGGSLFWVIRNLITVRQQIVSIETVTRGAETWCEIGLEARYVRTEATHRKPFQGWRYLPADAAPLDLIGEGGSAAKASGAAATPALTKALREAGVW